LTVADLRGSAVGGGRSAWVGCWRWPICVGRLLAVADLPPNE